MGKSTYTLIHEDELTTEKLRIRTSEYIVDIDAFTTNFANEFELWKALSMAGYHFFDDNFYVEQQNGKRITKLPVAYSDQKSLQRFASNNQGKANVKKDIEQCMFVTRLAEKVEQDYELARYLLHNHYITAKVHDDLAEYNMLRTTNVEASHSIFVSLREYFMNYSHIRKAAMGVKAYQEKNIKQEETETAQNDKVLVRKRTQANGQMRLF